MNYVIENWFLIVLAIAIVVVGVVKYIQFRHLTSDEQIKKVKKWLLAVVIEAEKQFGGKTGRIKLSHVYFCFIKAFPRMADYISFDLFSLWVDEVLDEMRKMLQDNENVKNYVNGV